MKSSQPDSPSSALRRGERLPRPRWALALLPALLLTISTARAETLLPRLIFVSRHAPTGASAGQVPGLGPRGRSLASGGRLMIREHDGRVYALLAPGALWDVSDPCVSWDGRRIVLAGTPSPDSAWRLWTVDADGRNLAPLTHTDRAVDLSVYGASASRFERYDDFDPAWLPDGRVCFASTRWPMIAAAEDVPATNLFIVDATGGKPRRITSERNGAEEPAVDPSTGRIVYARWWFNRWLASEHSPDGLTTDRALAVPSDAVNLWITASITPSGDGLRLAAGDPLQRSGEAAYQPVVARDGSVIAVHGPDPSLTGPGGGLRLQRLRGTAPAQPLTGPGLRGACASACAPALLPDGRVVFSYDARGDGDYGLATLDPATGAVRPVLDLRGTLELDAVALVPRRRPPVIGGLPPATSERPPFLPADLDVPTRTFRFDCLNLFANAPVDSRVPDALPITLGARIRFYAVLARPAAAGGDSAVLVRESPIDPGGAVHQHDLPADVPMFEQVVDGGGRVLRSAHGPAHVPGMNFSRAGARVQCVGCHVGHSTLRVPASYGAGAWFNASPSATVEASSEARGTAGARALVDRRTRGPIERVAWIAESGREASVSLAWREPIEVGALVLFAPRAAPGTDLRVGGCEVVLRRGGQVVGRQTVRRRLSAAGTRVECGGVVADAVELRPARVSGRVRGRATVALAEVETVARLAP